MWNRRFSANQAGRLHAYTGKGREDNRNAKRRNGNEKERAKEVGRGCLNTRRNARAPSVRRKQSKPIHIRTPAQTVETDSHPDSGANNRNRFTSGLWCKQSKPIHIRAPAKRGKLVLLVLERKSRSEHLMKISIPRGGKKIKDFGTNRGAVSWNAGTVLARQKN